MITKDYGIVYRTKFINALNLRFGPFLVRADKNSYATEQRGKFISCRDPPDNFARGQLLCSKWFTINCGQVYMDRSSTLSALTQAMLDLLSIRMPTDPEHL
ncbi:MAG: hypothetical protein NVV73_20875 [Cellvibrionaceae bacterium]|nr:hypothetical protein [Cellvibrionaceae bacterium]